MGVNTCPELNRQNLKLNNDANQLEPLQKGGLILEIVCILLHLLCVLERRAQNAKCCAILFHCHEQLLDLIADLNRQ